MLPCHAMHTNRSYNIPCLKQWHRLASHNAQCKLIHCHVRASPRPIHGEQPEPSGPQPILRAVGVGKVFVGGLESCIHVTGGERGKVRGEGEGSATTIYAGGGSIYQGGVLGCEVQVCV